MVYNFDSGMWQCDGVAEFLMNENHAVISKKNVALACLMCTIPFDDEGGIYRLSVSCEFKNCKNATAPYVVVTQLDENKNHIMSAYGENVDFEGKVKKCCFEIKEGCKALSVELGLKFEGEVAFTCPVLEKCEVPEKRNVKVAATYLDYSPTEEVALSRISEMIDNVSKEKPDIVILSETLNTLGCNLAPENKPRTINDSFCTLMREKAREYNTYIVANFIEKDGADCYNTSVLIDRKGNIAGKYRKTHITHGEWSAGIVPGDKLPVFETDFGKVGLLICWDAYFPETARILASKGAELIVISTIGDASIRHVSRALENGVYVAVAGAHWRNLNNCGIEPSKIISPCGEILSQTKESGKAAIAEIDLNDKGNIPWLSFECRNTIPVNVYLNERRTDMYSDIMK